MNTTSGAHIAPRLNATVLTTTSPTNAAAKTSTQAAALEKITVKFQNLRFQQIPTPALRGRDSLTSKEAVKPPIQRSQGLSITDLAKGKHITSKNETEASPPKNTERANDSSAKPAAPRVSLGELMSDGHSDIFSPGSAPLGEPLPPNAIKKGIQECTADVALKFYEYATFTRFTHLNTDDSENEHLFKPTSKNSGEVAAPNNTHMTDKEKLKQEITDGLSELGFTHSSNGMFYNTQTGTSFMVVIERRTVSFCFGGLGSEKMIEESGSKKENKDLHSKMGSASRGAALRDFVGGVPKAATQAMDIGVLLKTVSASNGFEPVVIGHSHGGGLAECAAAAGGIQGVVFNARPLGVGVRKAIAERQKTNNTQTTSNTQITAFVTKNDWVAHKTGLLHTLGRMLSPKNKEKRPASIADVTYSVPTPLGNKWYDSDTIYDHNNIMYSLFQVTNPNWQPPKD